MQKTEYQTSQEKHVSVGLFSGKMGLAICLFHSARVCTDKYYEEQALALMEEIQEELHQDTIFEYANGLAGIGSAISYLFRERFIEPSGENYFSEIDAYFFNRVCFEQHTDLSRDAGLIGIGCYLLNRIKDLPTLDSMASAKSRHMLLLIQDVLFARMGMNGYYYPYLKMEALPESVLADIKRFLSRMLKTSLCPELTQKALSIINGKGQIVKTLFAEMEDAYNQGDGEKFQSLLKTLTESPEDSPAKQLAILQIQDMSLPAWWELF